MSAQLVCAYVTQCNLYIFVCDVNIMLYFSVDQVKGRVLIHWISVVIVLMMYTMWKDQ